MTAVQYIIGIVTVVFGIASLIISSRAASRLSDGLIKRYINNFSICLAFIVIFTMWRAMRDYMEAIYGISKNIEIAEYMFIIGAFIGFVIASFRVVQISREFGFYDRREIMREALSEKKGKTVSHARKSG